MRIYYLFAPIERGCVGPTSGIERKVRAQVAAMNAYDSQHGETIDCALVILPTIDYKSSIAEKMVRRLPGTSAWRKWKYNGEFNDADVLYIRKVREDSTFILYLKEIKRANPRIKIIYEIPTYPEKPEINKLSNFSFQKKEENAQAKLKKYVDRIVTFYGQNEIYGIPCIKLQNGYDFSSVQLPLRKKTTVVQMLSVALNAYWHGYERLIRGIENYYANGGTEQIIYHIVGTPLNEYETNDPHVVLHDSLYGEDLKELYKECLVGIDILGGHRKNYPVSSTLKSREYAAYGLPMVTSSPIDYMPKDYPYQFLATYDDRPVDIKALLHWYHAMYDYKDCNEVAKEIRDYAISRCDMKVTMQPVLDYLFENKSKNL